MDPNQQPQDFNKPNEPAETPATPQMDTPTQGGFAQPSPAPAVDFSANPEPVSASTEPASPAPAPFGQSAETSQPVTPQPAFPSPEVPPVGQAPVPYQGENPGQTLGIVSIVLSVVGFSLIGLILGIVSRNKSKSVGAPTTLGTIGMVLGIVLTVIGVLIVGFMVLISMVAYGGIQERATSSQTHADANTLMKYAEVYNAENGAYPASSADIDTSTLSTDTKVVTSTPSEMSEVQYVKCDDASAQVLYFDNYDSKVKIIPLGTASSTTPC